MSVKFSFLAAAVSLLMACGGSPEDSESSEKSGGGRAPSIVFFTATPANLPAAGGSVTLAWSVSGAASLSIDQGVGDVTGLSSKVVSVTAGKTFALTATNAAGSSSGHATVTVAGVLEIHGKLLSYERQPVSGITILIPAKPSVHTDSAGAFTIVGVTPPYEAWIVDTANKILVVYKGLTRSDPVLAHPEPVGSIHHASVSGAITGGSYPEPPMHHTTVSFSSPEARTHNSTDGNGAYILPTSWRGQGSTVGALHALQIRETSSGIPAEYKGYGKRELTLSDGLLFGPQNISMNPVASSRLSGSVLAPAGYTLSLKAAFLSVGSGPDLLFVADSSSASSFSYVSPNIPNTSLILWSVASKAGNSVLGLRAGLAANSTGVNMTIPAAAEPISPLDAATGVNGTSTFSWSAFSNGVHQIFFNPGVAGLPSYYVWTTSTTTTIPDGNGLGLGLPAASRYTWHVEGFSPYASTDAAATTAFID